MQKAAKILSVLIVCVFFYFGFHQTEPCGIDNATLYCNLHPFKFWDGLGILLFLIGTAGLFGWFEILREEFDIEVKDWRIFSGAAIGIGFLLTLL